MRAITDPVRVRVLPDPPVPGAPGGQWWPPVALAADWLLTHADDYDVLHVHFGLESFSPAELGSALDAARRAGRPVVYTVHDLENPQIVDQEPYRALLDVIIPAADRLLTLTTPSAEQIERQWGRPSQVLTHPTLLDRATTARPADDHVTHIGIHLRDLRPNIDAVRAVRAAVDAAALLAQEGIAVGVDVLVNDRVRDDETAARVIAAADAHPSIRIRRTLPLTDAAIEEWLARMDLFVLPYLHGTHSGWVELCHDLALPVAGTAVGSVAAQHPADFAVIDLSEGRTLADAIRRVASGGRDASQRSALIARRRRERVAERAAVRAAHADLYAAACAEVMA